MSRTLRYHEFLCRLKPFGVIELPSREKGSERYLVRAVVPGTTRGPACTVRCHGSGDELKPGAISACLRRLQIDPKDFWSQMISELPSQIRLLHFRIVEKIRRSALHDEISVLEHIASF